MIFLQGIVVGILKWLLEMGGRAAYDYINRKIDEHEQKKINKDNSKKHADDIRNNAPPDQRGKSGRKLINGEK
jgi:hypothetical protein